jgi:TolB-like protein
MDVNSKRQILPAAYTFSDVIVDSRNFRVLKNGQPRPLEPRAFEVLIFLIENRGRVIQKEEIFEQIWKQSFVTDSALTQEIKNIRKAIGDDASSPRFIETVRKHGYRFIGQLEQVPSVGEARERASAQSRLVVLPFVNLDLDSEREYLSDAFTEEFITELAALAPTNLLVIARTTSMHFKHTEKDVAQICSELCVDYLVEGSIRHEDDHITIVLQLIQASDQMHLLSRRYEIDTSRFFSMRTTMADEVARQIGIPPDANRANERAKRKPTEDAVAYGLYLKARFLDRTPENIARAKEYYEEAIARDSNFALAYDGLAELFWYLSFAGVGPPIELSAAGMFYATRALEIDSTLAETHALLAMYRKELDYNWTEVKREMDLALELDPESPLVRFRYALSWLMPQGCLEESAIEVERVLESDPLCTFYRSWLAVILWLNREYDRAIEQARMIVKFDPQAYTGYWMLGMICRERGSLADAIEAQRKAVELSGGLPLLLGWHGLALGQAGETAEARALLDQLHEIAKTTYVPPSSFALTYFGLGELDEAFVWLDRAVDVRDHMMIPIKSYPFFDSVHEDPRYLALLRKMNYDTEGPGTNYGRGSGSR